MQNSTRFLVLTGMLIAGMAFAPDRSFAQEEVDADDEETIGCTKQYEQCLDDAEELRQPFETMADIECFAQWTGCVTRKLLVE